MAALLNKLRNHQAHPAMTQAEIHAQFGIQTPRIQRASLPSNTQRHAAVKPTQNTISGADVQSYAIQIPRRTTDTLQASNLPIIQGSYASFKGLIKNFVQFLVTLIICLAGLATILYTIVFFAAAGILLLSNAINYGPTHTAYSQATIAGQSTTIETSNVKGAIHITLITTAKDGSISYKIYSGPTLNQDAWNNDLSGIIVTAEVPSNQANPTIKIHLTGNLNYFHLFKRPHMDLSLIPDKTGYRMVIDPS